MAASDPLKFSSSAQIFSANHTLPQIRSIHKTLHAEVEEKSTRLRTQVGGSYRELLGTADTIVRMHSDNNAVQELLGGMGGRCGRTVVEIKASGLAKFVMRQKDTETAKAAKLRLLDGCALMVGRILKGGGGLDSGVGRGERLILATKIWILIRLLVKSLGDEIQKEDGEQELESAKKTVSALRRRLERAFDKTLAKNGEDSEREDLLKAICARSLSNSSGAKDALWHFLQVRREAMELALDTDESERVVTADDMIHSLKLYTKTLLDVQALVPAKLSQALAGLKKHPILADRSLQQLEGLRLDIHKRWCGEEIEDFTPFIRHDDLDGKQARELFNIWAEKGGEFLLHGLKKTLQLMTDFKSVMELRTQVLQLWIREGAKVRGFDPQEMQDNLRVALNSRMLSVLEAKVTKLRLVGSEVKATLEGWQNGATGKHQSLWDDDGYDEALSRGAAPFVQAVVSRLYGRSDAVSKAVHCYTSWYHIIDDVKGVVESLRKQRWDNDYDEIEDEDTIEARQQLLSKDDPQKLEDKLNTALDNGFKQLQEQLQKLWGSNVDHVASGDIAMYMLRVLRDIRSQLPKRQAIQKFGLVMVPVLHEKIAMQVALPAVTEFTTSYLKQREVITRPLWEGQPELPSQPSPEVFQFLRMLSMALADAGMDLWTPAAMSIAKKHISMELCAPWHKELERLASEGSTEDKQADASEDEDEEDDKDDDEDKEKGGEEEEEASEDGNGDEKMSPSKPASLSTEEMQDIHIQWLFDVALLRLCVGNMPEEAAERLDRLADAIHKRTGLEGDTSRQRMETAAKNFWGRTSLLFGLLA